MRFEWLDDRIDELVDRYESGQSLRDIADEFEVSPPTIHRRLKETGVEMRNGGPRHVRLEDEAHDLVELYVEQERSLQAIAETYETSISAIRFHLEGADVECEPTNFRSNDVDVCPYQHSVVQGELLGDGCLHPCEEGCFFQLSTTTEAHAVRLKEKLPSGLFPESQPYSYTRPNEFTGEEYTMWTVSSRPQSRFDRMYDQWYEVLEDQNRKRVPDQFHLDQTALLHWYWGDGSCSIRDHGAPRVSFATHGFPESSVRHLQGELDRIGYDNYAIKQEGVKRGSGRFIRLRDYDARRLLDDVRRMSTIPEYDHKFPVPAQKPEA